MNINEIETEIFDKLENNFEEKALAIFQFQAIYLPIYKQYIELLKIDTAQVKSIHQIPFLPISFFKTNEIYLTLDLFFQTAKLQKVRLKFKDKKYFLKNKTLSKKETLSLKASSINKSKVALFLIQQFKKFQNNLVILNIRILNFSVRKELLLFYYKKLKKFSGFFSRRLNFFVDFLKSYAYSVFFPYMSVVAKNQQKIICNST